MAYNLQLAEKVRDWLAKIPKLQIAEKKMFAGLAFMINEKMCVNVSGDNLMCRFDPELIMELERKPGFKPMIMKGKVLKGYCYVEPVGFKSKKDFDYWLNLCLDFNERAKSSKN